MGAAEPAGVQHGIAAAGRDQLFVRAQFADPAFGDDRDPVGVLDRREPVRDHDRGAIRQQLRKGAGGDQFRARVEVGGGLVEGGSDPARARTPDVGSS